MAARAGAMMADMEFVQFHPTALDVNKDPAPLATEALRGHGATLINRAGERFMLKLDPDAELGPRDVVARGIYAEVMAGRGAWLDCTKAVGASFAEELFGGGQQDTGGKSIDSSGHLLWRGEGGRDPDVPVAWILAIGKSRACSRHRDPCPLGQLDHASRRSVGYVEADEVPAVRIGPGNALVIAQTLAED